MVEEDKKRVRISDWYVPGRKFTFRVREPLSFAVTFFGAYALGVLFEEFGLFLGKAGLAIFFIGIYFVVLDVDLSPGKLLMCGDVSFAAMIFLHNMFFMGGIFLGVGVSVAGVSAIAVLVVIAFTMLFLLYIFYIIPLMQRPQERMTVQVGDNYSLHFVQHIMTMMERWLTHQGYFFEKVGNRLWVIVDEFTQIGWGFFDICSYRSGCEYEFMVQTNTSKDSPDFKKLKEALSSIVLEIETTEGIESFPKVTSTKCVTCNRKVLYIVSDDLFSCGRCDSRKEEHDVTIETTN